MLQGSRQLDARPTTLPPTQPTWSAPALGGRPAATFCRAAASSALSASLSAANLRDSACREGQEGGRQMQGWTVVAAGKQAA